jgi:uracil-DNA glycosylase family 4
MPKKSLDTLSTPLQRKLIGCTRCERLVACRETIPNKPAKGFTAADYWSKPVPGFGDPKARLLILGLAPGAHGANRSGRPFTGDAAGTWLYPALHKFGFANQPESTHRGDGLVLRGAYITNAVKCVPPGNRPLPAEQANCVPYLQDELDTMKDLRVILPLGGIALQAYLQWAVARSHLKKRSLVPFAHGGEYPLPNGHHLVMSYHCSRLNTNTGRLTLPMFEAVFARARQIIDA